MNLLEKTKNSNAKKIVSEAIEMKDLFIKVKDLKNKMINAMQARNVPEIRSLLDVFAKIDLKKFSDLNETISKAQQVISEFDSQQKPFDELNAFMQNTKDRLLDMEEIRKILAFIADCEKTPASLLNPQRTEVLTHAKGILMKSARAPLDVNSYILYIYLMYIDIKIYIIYRI
jgi:hypothetical protein